MRQDISAVIVTRGDVDLQPILDTIPFDDVVIWDNLRRPFDAKIFGRYLAMLEARNDLCFSIDDDAICSDINALLAAWEPGLIVSNMDAEWVRKGKYDDLGFCGGAGGFSEKRLVWDAIDRYLNYWPIDDEFLIEADFVTGIICPSRHVYVGYELRTEITTRSIQLCHQPWQEATKQNVMKQARWIRDRSSSSSFRARKNHRSLPQGTTPPCS